MNQGKRDCLVGSGADLWRLVVSLHRESQLRLELALARAVFCLIGLPLILANQSSVTGVGAGRGTGEEETVSGLRPHLVSEDAEFAASICRGLTVSSVSNGERDIDDRKLRPVGVHIGWFVFFYLFESVSNEARVNVVDGERSGLGQVAPCQGVVFWGQDWIAALETVKECGQRHADKEIHCHTSTPFRFGGVPEVFSGVGSLEVVDDPFQVFAAGSDPVELGA